MKFHCKIIEYKMSVTLLQKLRFNHFPNNLRVRDNYEYFFRDFV